MPLLEVKNICVSFDGRQILKGVDLNLNEGELVSILGLSGSGKSTLFNVISGLLKPQEGDVYINGENVTGKTGYVSYMLQKDLLMPFKTVLDNVAMPLLIKGMKKKDARMQADKCLRDFGLSGTQSLYPNELSGGMRQRVAFLRTYLFAGKAALLDEPFSALDTITKSQVHEWYIHVMEKIKLSTLFITHDINEAIHISDRIYILGDNPARIVSEIVIDPSDVRTSDNLLSESFLTYKKRILSELSSSPVI